MSYLVTEGAATDVGRVREGNEDSLLVRPPLYIVADGMGGHLGGEVASALAVKTVAMHIERQGPASLPEGVAEANRAVFRKQEGDASLAGMGTTLTAALIDEEGLHLAHVGDSRAYLIRGQAVRMLTEDHTMVGELVRAKRLTPDEAREHPQRSMLTRALGIDARIDVDVSVVGLEDGDRIILCSDGLNASLTEEEIALIATAGAPTATAHALVDAANAAGGVDNITVIVLDVSVVDPSGINSGGFADMLPPVRIDEPRSPSDEPTPRAQPPTSTPSRAAASRAPTTQRSAASADPIPLWRSRIVIAAALIFLVFLVGASIYARSHTYIGVADGRVAIFHGLPGSFLGIPLHSVSEVTELDAARVREVGGSFAGDLEDGLPVIDDESAQALIARYRGLVETLDATPASPASPSPSPPEPASLPSSSPIAGPVP